MELGWCWAGRDKTTPQWLQTQPSPAPHGPTGPGTHSWAGGETGFREKHPKPSWDFYDFKRRIFGDKLFKSSPASSLIFVPNSFSAQFVLISHQQSHPRFSSTKPGHPRSPIPASPNPWPGPASGTQLQHRNPSPARAGSRAQPQPQVVARTFNSKSFRLTFQVVTWQLLVLNQLPIINIALSDV